MSADYEDLRARTLAVVARRNAAHKRMREKDAFGPVDLALARELREAEAALSDIWDEIAGEGEAYATWLVERDLGVVGDPA